MLKVDMKLPLSIEHKQKEYKKKKKSINKYKIKNQALKCARTCSIL